MRRFRFLLPLLSSALVAPTAPEPAMLAIAAVAEPNCDAPGSEAAATWCLTAAPDSERELPQILAALERMQKLGSHCAELSRTTSALLARGAIHLHDSDQYSGGGAAPIGAEASGYMLLSRELVSHYYDAAHRSGNVDSRGTPRPITLQFLLAHEADHLLGADHIDPDGYLTPHALECSDLR